MWAWAVKRGREREKATIRSVCGTEGSERDVETSRRRMLDQRAAPQLCIVSHPIIPLSNPERKTRGANRIDPARPPRVKLVFFLCQLSVPFTLRVVMCTSPAWGLEQLVFYIWGLQWDFLRVLTPIDMSP